ncbi:ribonuclease E/G [Fibrella sp. WM1]|uniref:Ribonuclease, Rne/Rng family n=1 Tax=Fibrella aestuarina BUZ 2 TaxID=1166018 RepID=I0K543_9BACT|nr:Rne/Rng family ribonuclease [Fibrella aestuarina]CCG99246.1 ribonuclease, Rne/Rng family [Fibrella aestuarina BUZ 2]
MSNEIVISSTQKGDRIALLQDKRLLEYHLDESESSFTVGDLYLGTVKKLSSGLNAAFVDVGHEKDGFLHYQDLGQHINSLNKLTKEVIAKRVNTGRLSDFEMEPAIEKIGKIDKVLTKGQSILVQVVKEPISTKGPRLSCDISIAGRYLVLVPFSNGVNLSKKITDRTERNRLIKLMSAIKPKNFGVIVRTVAQGKEVEELDRDLQNSIDKWDRALQNLRDAKPRDRVLSEMNRASSILRDMLNESFDSITVDTKEGFDQIREFIHTIAPEKEKIVKLYSGKAKLFESLGLEKQIKSLFGRSVSLPGGGYLIIEHTEALHVIDVNSGNKSNSEEDQEATAISVNREAAREIARQLRLRDMGGIIVVDFIDMKKADNKKLIFDIMRDEMKGDRSKFTILPLTKFGLMQITRQRVRPELNIVTREVCPTCGGTGTIQASVLITDIIEGNVDYILTKQNERGIQIVLHPFLYAYFTKGFPSPQHKWFLKYKTWVKLTKDSSLGITDFRFLNKHGEEIELATNPTPNNPSEKVVVVEA